MIITSNYNAKAKTITVTDTTVYAPGERENLNLSLLADGEEVATFEAVSDSVSYVIPADGIRSFTVESYDAFTGDLAATSNTLRQLTTEYAYEESIALLKKALKGKLSIQPYLDNIKLLKSAQYHFGAGNYYKARQILNYYADAR